MTDKSHLSSTSLYLITFILATCSILYELLIAQSVSLVAGNPTVWYSVSIGLYLGSMGLGAFLFKKIIKSANHLRALFGVELGLSLVGALAPIVVHSGHTIALHYLKLQQFKQGTVFFFVASGVMVLLVGFLSGIELPLLISLGNRNSKSRTNRVLAADYFGALVGSIAFPLFLLPLSSYFGIAFFVAALNASIALVVASCFIKGTLKPIGIFANALLVIALLIGIKEHQSIDQYFLQRYYYHEQFGASLIDHFRTDISLPTIKRTNSNYQKIDLVKALPIKEARRGDLSKLLRTAYSKKFERQPDYPNDYTLYINGDPQISFSVSEIYHEYLAHVPILMTGRTPENILILGGGDGILVKELAKYKTIAKITVVDIDPAIVTLATTDPILLSVNENALKDSRVELVYDDAYNFTRTSKQNFDAVYLDIPFPFDYNLARLYSKEFYALLRNRIKPDGFIAMRADEVNSFSFIDESGEQKTTSDNPWSDYYFSLKAGGFKSIKPFFSSLEISNKKAFALLHQSPRMKRFENEKWDERLNRIRRLIRYYVYSVQMGFIVASKEERTYLTSSAVPEIELDVLNEERFKLSFRSPLSVPTADNQLQVNSIMKPTWPKTPPWLLRIPYSTGRIGPR